MFILILCLVIGSVAYADQVDDLMQNDGVAVNAVQPVAVDVIQPVPVKPWPPDAPDQKIVADVQDQEKLADAPDQKKISDVPDQEKISDAPDQKKIIDAPDQEKISDAPDQRKLIDAPDQEKISDAPEQKKLIDAPDQEKLVDAPDQAAVEEAKIITLPSETEMRDSVNFIGEARRLFRDRNNRNWQIRAGNMENMKRWIEIYKADCKIEPGRIPLKTGIRMISNFRLPANDDAREILRQNLAFYKKNGYNAVLFLADDLDHLDETIAVIRKIKSEFGLMVFAAYGPPGEGVNAPFTFLPPEHFASWLVSLAREIDGWILGWGRTSAHLFTQDGPYIRFVCSALRKGRGDLPIIGEIYWGENYKVNKVSAYYYHLNTFANASADIIQNRGHLTVDKEMVVRKHAAMTGGHPAIGVVIGPKTEWLSSTSYSWDAAFAAKRKIEKQFLHAGCIGTITCHADGLPVSKCADGRIVYEDLTQSLYSQINAIKPEKPENNNK